MNRPNNSLHVFPLLTNTVSNKCLIYYISPPNILFWNDSYSHARADYILFINVYSLNFFGIYVCNGAETFGNNNF